MQFPTIADNYAVDIGTDIYRTSVLETSVRADETFEQERAQASQSFTAEKTGLIHTMELDLSVCCLDSAWADQVGYRRLLFQESIVNLMCVCGSHLGLREGPTGLLM